MPTTLASIPLDWSPHSGSADKRRQILDGANEVFLSSGFDGASMGEIARVAGVSKGTLYVYFASKEELFSELLREKCGRTAERCFVLDPDGDPRTVLMAVGHSYVMAMIEADNIATLRLVFGIAEKFPAIGNAYLSAGTETGVRMLCDWLKVKCARGELAIDDPELAAWQLICSSYSKIVVPVLFGRRESQSDEEIERIVAFTVDSFLRSFAAPRA